MFVMSLKQLIDKTDLCRAVVKNWSWIIVIYENDPPVTLVMKLHLTKKNLFKPNPQPPTFNLPAILPVAPHPPLPTSLDPINSISASFLPHSSSPSTLPPAVPPPPPPRLPSPNPACWLWAGRWVWTLLCSGRRSHRRRRPPIWKGL